VDTTPAGEVYMHYTPNDRVRYVGDALPFGHTALCAGDEGTVITGNLDEDDDVLVRFRAYGVDLDAAVSPHDLLWLSHDHSNPF
jgi:hypothetical protein